MLHREQLAKTNVFDGRIVALEAFRATASG
jgi:hypothetical protein